MSEDSMYSDGVSGNEFTVAENCGWAESLTDSDNESVFLSEILLASTTIDESIHHVQKPLSGNMNCFQLFENLPPELQLLVLGYLSKETIRNLVMISPVKKAAGIVNKSHHQTLRYLQVSQRYAAEASILEVSRLLYGRDLLHCEQGTSRYLDHMERLKSAVETITYAIQRSLKSIRQTTLVRQHLLLLQAMLSLPCPARHFDIAGLPEISIRQRLWFFWTEYSREERLGITNFLENVCTSWYHEYPAKYENINSNVCTHLHYRTCPWRFPKRLLEELEALGVFQYVIKAKMLHILAQIFGKLHRFPQRNPPRAQVEDVVRDLSTFCKEPLKFSRFESWACHARFRDEESQFKAEISLQNSSYIIVIYGSRGKGIINLLMDPRDDLMRLLDLSLMLPDGSLPPLEDIAEEQDLGLSRSFLRLSYWDTSLDSQEDLGLTDLFVLEE